MRRLVSLLALLSIGGVGAEKQTGWKFLLPDTFKVGDAPLHPGDGWLALTSRHGGWQLEPAVVKARRVAKYEFEDGDAPGIEISTNVKDTLALVRLPGLAEGKVVAAKINLDDPYSWVTPISLRGANYAVRTVSNKPGDISLTYGGRLYLSLNGKQKTLLQGVASGECMGAQIRWAGDLDGDGMLDLIFYDGVGYALFLSKDSPPGKLIHLVATIPLFASC